MNKLIPIIAATALFFTPQLLAKQTLINADAMVDVEQ
jgi:hypothetical protein